MQIWLKVKNPNKDHSKVRGKAETKDPTLFDLLLKPTVVCVYPPKIRMFKF